MIDVFNIPSQQQQTYTLYATGNWQTWNKPRGAKMIEIFCLGGGGGGGHPVLAVGALVGGGGGGFQDVGTKAGGGSGGSGATARLTINANLLPDIALNICTFC